jgi:hypothetical protein
VARVTWWAWVLLWVVLVAAAALVLYLAARRLFRQGAALARELGDAAETLAAVSARLDRLDRLDAAGADPAALAPGSSPARRRSSPRGSSPRR